MAEDRTAAQDRFAWEVATEREGEIRRVGFGVVELQKTLQHLKERGDSRASYRRTDGADGWADVSLTLPLPIGGSHRAS